MKVRPLHPSLFCKLATLALLVASPLAHGEKVWTNSLSGLWQDRTNWLNADLPQMDSFVRITNDTTKTVTINSLTPTTNLTVQMLTLSAPPGTTNTLLLTDVGVTNPLVFQFGLDLENGAD